MELLVRQMTILVGGMAWSNLIPPIPNIEHSILRLQGTKQRATPSGVALGIKLYRVVLYQFSYFFVDDLAYSLCYALCIVAALAV